MDQPPPPVSYILAIATAVPPHCFSQDTFAGFYQRSTDDDYERRKIGIISRKSGIRQRHSVIPDFGSSPEDFCFFAPNPQLLPEPSLSRRMDEYRKHAAGLSARAIRQIEGFEGISQQITHLITVTCTGLFAPGTDIDLIQGLGLNPAVSRLSVNFMGCNAAIIALKQADMICKADPSALVLIVCTELCSLHFQRRYNDDYILSNLIFGDGSAAVLVGGSPLPGHNPVLAISRFDSLLTPTGYQDMAWQLSETGFLMNLSSYVSSLIQENIGPMFRAIGLDPSDIRHWAIHPGGKKILDDVASVLALRNGELSHSYDVLRDHGNMSSPTVLFVLKALLSSRTPAESGDKLLAVAFGPGLSIETMQLQYV